MSDQTIRQVRRYRRERLLLLGVAFLMGLALAYAEWACWFPTCVSKKFPRTRTAILCIGPALCRAALAPLLMVAGLTPTGYYHFSRICLFVFCFFHGVDYLPFVLSPSLRLLAAATLSILLLCLTIRMDTTAARGIMRKSRSMPCAVSVPRYLYQGCLLWGESFLIQFAFCFVDRKSVV